MKETSRKLFYKFRNCYKIWNELSGWKGSVTYGLGADLSLPQCLSVTTGIWTLTHKSDLRAEISGSIVWYDALAPRPEVLLSWYSVCACAVYLGQKLLPYSWKKSTDLFNPATVHYTYDHIWQITVDRNSEDCLLILNFKPWQRLSGNRIKSCTIVLNRYWNIYSFQPQLA